MKKLKIDIIVNDGSPLGVTTETLLGNDTVQIGVGGAELALLTLCEGWHLFGHSVRLYNNPRNPKGSLFPQLPLVLFNPKEERDVLIIFRSPNERSYGAKGKKIWWSTDQYTVGNFPEFATTVNQIVTISEFHSDYFKNTYGIDKSISIDLPVRSWEYANPLPKIKNRLIFCSVPDRGLDILSKCYGKIVQKIPDVSLIITSDYRLWGASGAMNEQFIHSFFGKPNVKFLGAISRAELIKEQLQAQIQAYPCIYDELFCYAVAECQTAGTIPITPNRGALATTNMGYILEGQVESPIWQNSFVDLVCESLSSSDLTTKQKELREKAFERFSLDEVMKKWDNLFQS